MPGGATTVDIRPDGVGVLTLRHKPVNALSQDVCKSAKENLDKLIADPKVKAIVVTGEGKLFSGGADIVEFGMITMMDPAEAKKIGTSALQSVLNTLDSSPKTTVAALNGDAIRATFRSGGGYRLLASANFGELVLGCIRIRIRIRSRLVFEKKENLGVCAKQKVRLTRLGKYYVVQYYTLYRCAEKSISLFRLPI